MSLLSGIRSRRGHDLRRTFVSLAEADGVRRDAIESGTHGARGDIMSMYTSLPWPTLCEEWAKKLRNAWIHLRHSVAVSDPACIKVW